MGSSILFTEKTSETTIHFTLPKKEKVPPKVHNKKVIVISGPTAVGKTELSLKIAEAIGGEIISADSMQVYRGMDIGTAKASQVEREKVIHHLIDCRDLDESFNVVDFYHEAKNAIEQILLRDHVPIIVGGTGFYIHALLYGPPAGPPSVESVRERLEHEMLQTGPLAMYEKLKEIDPEYASTISSRDRHKIIRGLEIISLTSKKVSFFTKESTHLSLPYEYRCWFLYLPKEILYPRIEKRCDEMIQRGFVEEVERLEKAGIESNISASQAIGYRQCLEYLHSKKTKEDWDRFVSSFQQASKRYAKRQFTWFRKEPLFRWLNRNLLTLENAVELILQDFEN